MLLFIIYILFIWYYTFGYLFRYIYIYIFGPNCAALQTTSCNPRFFFFFLIAIAFLSETFFHKCCSLNQQFFWTFAQVCSVPAASDLPRSRCYTPASWWWEEAVYHCREHGTHTHILMFLWILFCILNEILNPSRAEKLFKLESADITWINI